MAKLSQCLFFLLFLAAAQGLPPKSTFVGFYWKTCRNAEGIVKKTIAKHFQANPTICPSLVRMQFHDCFVRGCDASILLNGSNTEKTAGPNLRLRGWEALDDAKAQLEKNCPGVVSCADILAIAVRDCITQMKGPFWMVPTGRRDGTVSLASEANNLPAANDSLQVQLSKFKDKGLDAIDLVALVGAHTIGTSACFFFRNRLYNFTSNGGPDGSISPSFLKVLRAKCPPNGDVNVRVELDFKSSTTFDTSIFTHLINNEGVLLSDQVLTGNDTTNAHVQSFTDKNAFMYQFITSMIKMSNVGVLTGKKGEVRKVCYASN